jgi:hypothetical protein
MDFAWSDLTQKHPLQLVGELNGNHIYISPDDPNPCPIDVTPFLLTNGQVNGLEFSLVKSQTPLAISIRAYVPVTMSEILTRLTGGCGVDPLRDSVSVKGLRCRHPEVFELAGFLSRAVINGKGKCPICGDTLGINEVVFSSCAVGGRADRDKEMTWDRCLQ